MHLRGSLLAVLALCLSSYSYSYDEFYEETLFEEAGSEDSSGKGDNSGWYLGSMIGNAKFNYDGGGNDTTFFSGGYWGINFNDVLGLESTVFSTSDDSNGVKNTFLALTITPKINIQFHNRFSVYLKGGIALSHATSDYKDDEDDTPSWSGSIPTYGLGAEFRLFHGLETRLAYDKLKGKLAFNDSSSFEDFKDADIDLELMTLGIHYQF